MSHVYASTRRTSHAVSLGLLTACVVSLALGGCNKDGTVADAGHLKPLAKLPPLDVKPSEWSISNRARLLMKDGKAALAKQDCQTAAQLSVEAVTLDPSLTEARLEASRVFARCGVPVTALGFLEQLASEVERCGGCREAVAASQQDKLLAPLWKTASGAKVAKKLEGVDLSVPIQKWAEAVAADLAKGKAEALATLIHPFEPWKLVRSCPRCADEARHTPEVRQFFGYIVARKLATRFTPSARDHGAVPLILGGAPTCSGRCCQWPVATPLPLDSAALKMLCFRPITPTQGALTRLELVYGQPAVDAEATQAAQLAVKNPKTRANGGDDPNHRVVHLAAPSTSVAVPR